MIVRLYPKTDLSKVWNYIETEIKDNPDASFRPLFATQTEGMMDIGLIFDVEQPDLHHGRGDRSFLQCSYSFHF